MFTAPQNFGNELRIDGFDLINHPVAEGGVPAGGGEGLADIQVNLTYLKKSLNNKTVSRRVAIKVITAPLPGGVSSCETTAVIPDSGSSLSCVWSQHTLEDASWGIAKCSGRKRLIGGGCHCGGTGCSSTNPMYYSSPVIFEPANDGVLQCINNVPPPAGCGTGTVRIVCTGNACNAWDCRFHTDVAEMYISTLCCDPTIP